MKTLLVAALSAVSLLFVAHAVADIDPDTLVGAWLFDESSGDTAKDSSRSGNDGTLTKGPARVDGVFGNALEFDGTNGVEIDQPANFDFLTWTYVLWFRAEAGGDYPNLIGRQFDNAHGWTFHLDPAGGTFRIRIDSDGGINQVKTVPATVRDGEWHHGAIAHDDEEKTLELYIDGVKGLSDYAGDYENAGGFLKIGSPAVGAVNLNEGAIDDVGIFNVLLDEEDILAIMAEGLDGIGLLPVYPSGKLTSAWARIKRGDQR
jgi:hypothetical protein